MSDAKLRRWGLDIFHYVFITGGIVFFLFVNGLELSTQLRFYLGLLLVLFMTDKFIHWFLKTYFKWRS